MIDLKNLTENEIMDNLSALGEKPFRGRQIFKWIAHGALSFDEMTDLSKDLRERLSSEFHIGTLNLLMMQESKTDGTRKFLFGLRDDNAVESVFMKYKYGNSICVSSQAGCRMNCSFCASGKKGLARNLESGEMYDQIISSERITKERIGHVVVMGTGEPFDNYENVSAFIHIIGEKNGLGIGMRNITVSTSGIVPGIYDFARDFPQVNLAVSLHAPNDEIRGRMMPIAKTYPMEDLINACREYTRMTHRRVTFEYAVVQGVNDSEENMTELSEVLRGMLCHVNLIPLNEVSETGLKSGGRKRALEMAAYLENSGIPATVRRELGSDIDAACGQLRLNANTQQSAQK